MNCFHFVLAFVTLSPTLTTPREQIAPSMGTDGPLAVATTTFAGSPFLSALASYSMKIEPRFINEDTVLHKADIRVFNPRLNNSKS